MTYLLSIKTSIKFNLERCNRSRRFLCLLDFSCSSTTRVWLHPYNPYARESSPAPERDSRLHPILSRIIDPSDAVAGCTHSIIHPDAISSAVSVRRDPISWTPTPNSGERRAPVSASLAMGHLGDAKSAVWTPRGALRGL